MDEIIIKNINDRVDENDTIFFLGDFCMKRSSEASNAPQNAFDYYRNQIKCKNIIFVDGNHDGNNGTKTIIESLNINFGGHRIHMTHNPKNARDDFKFNYCGHCHGNQGTFRKLGKKAIIVDLSVDCWEFCPVDINEINQAYSAWLKSGEKR
jgi:calcineurin-like phosphoesterase family protein